MNDHFFQMKRDDLIDDYKQKKAFELNKTTLEHELGKAKARPSAMLNYAHKKHGVSKDWPDAHVN